MVAEYESPAFLWEDIHLLFFIAFTFMDNSMVQGLQAYANTTFGVWQKGYESFSSPR